VPWWVVLVMVGTVALLGGAATGINAAAASSAQAGEYYYGPVNCHSHPTVPAPGGSRQQYADYLVTTIAPRYHLEAAVLLWQVQQESGFNPRARSPSGAIGIAQFMPPMAAAYGVDPTDPWQALDGLARYDLASLRAFWGWSHTIAVRFGGNRNAYAWGMALAALYVTITLASLMEGQHEETLLR
jgi:peptidoglycan DL-endopeptidase CwlO